MSVDLVIAGNLLVDDIVFADGSTRLGQAGGALLHAALAGAAWGLRVGCVSVVGSDYPQAALSTLRARGVALAGVRVLPTPGLRVWLLHEDGRRHMVSRQGRPSHDEVSPEPGDLPLAWQHAGFVHLAPMPFTRQRALVAALGGGQRFVSLDPHRVIDRDSLAEWRALLAAADALFVSDDELRLDDLRPLASGRLRYVVHKRGARGGVLYDASTDSHWSWQPLAAQIVDVTGAGDAFAAGFLSALHHGLAVEHALARGAASASLALEGEGATSLAGASHDELVTRAAGCHVRRMS